MSRIDDPSALREHIGPVNSLAARKVLRRLDRHARDFIALSPLLVLATGDGDGHLDASPRGDPPGFVQVLDEVTLLIPDRPGNNRVDSFANLLANPGVGLIFFVPGIDETLRVNGSARLVTEPAALDASAVNGKTPRTGIVVTVEEVFFHCGKALKRSRLWDPEARIPRANFPSLGRVIADQIAGVSSDEADAKIEAAYRDRLY